MFILTAAGSAFAVPALDRSRTASQPDGTQITVYQRGDEFSHWLEDSSKRALVRTNAGRFEFATKDTNGRLKATGVMYKPNAAAPKGTASNYRPTSGAMMKTMLPVTAEKPKTLLQRAVAAVTSIFTGWHERKAEGEKKLMVVRVNFVNTSFDESENSPSSKDFYMNKIWSEGDNVLSVREYYKDQSQGKLKIVSADYSDSSEGRYGLLTVTLTSQDFNAGMHPDRKMNISTATIADEVALHLTEVQVVQNIMQHVSKDCGVDFSKFDTNKDGRITPDELCFYMIFSGWEESYSGYVSADYPMVWAHAWNSFTSDDVTAIENSGYDMSKYVQASHDVTIGGVVLANWALQGELGYDDTTSPKVMMQVVGAMAHELGHQMCRLPDLYDINGTNNGLGVFSIMAAGSWGYDVLTNEIYGARPTNLDAWSRIYLGWETPAETVKVSKSGANKTFKKPGTNGIIRLESPALDSSTEYLLAEVRDPMYDKWDRGMQHWMVGVLKNRYEKLYGQASADAFVNDFKTTMANGGGLVIQQVDENVGSGTLELGNDFNSSANPHQGNMPVTAVGDFRTLGGDDSFNALYTYCGLWFKGNLRISDVIDDLGKYMAGKTYFYGATDAVHARKRSGIALADISGPGATVTATVLYSEGSGSNSFAEPAKPAFGDDAKGLVTSFFPNIFNSTQSAAAYIKSYTSADFDEEDFTLDDAHHATLTEAAVKAADAKVKRVFPLPVFNVQELSSTRNACSFVVTSADLMAETPEQVKLLKLKGKAESFYFTYTDDVNDFVRDGYFTIQKDDTSGAIITRGAQLTDDYYRVTIFLHDNGDCDVDPANGDMLDPCAIISTNSGSSSGSSSGGCSAGFGALALLMLPFIARKKRDK